MRAIVATGPRSSADPACFEEMELPDPAPSPHDLLLAVEAVAVNPLDTKVRLSLPADLGTPRVLGWDVAGTVLAIGDAVRGFAAGDRVWCAGDIGRPGGNAERLAVDARLCSHRPASLGAAEAAALPLTALTAWDSLFERLARAAAGADAGRSLLILGGAGGVGSIAIQLARAAGLRVIASASRPESAAWVRQMGADSVVDHHRPLPPQLRELGLPVVDAIANFADLDAHWEAMAELIRPQGRIVAIVSSRGPLNLNLLKDKSAGFAWEYMFTRPRHATADMARQGEILRAVAERLDAGTLRTTLRESLTPISADTLRQAHAKLETGRTIGKIALEGWE
ncbi:MAG: zinc-binding alcohol dehydrogenase family protein [Synechococcaceae cyanobacterium]